MRNVVIILAVALLALAAIPGCGKSRNKSSRAYIGTYVSKDNPQNILRINKDRTYELEEKYPHVPKSTTTGTWKIDEDGIVMYVGQSRMPKIIGRREGNTLIDQLPGGDIWIKQ